MAGEQGRAGEEAAVVLLVEEARGVDGEEADEERLPRDQRRCEWLTLGGGDALKKLV